jgi:hypothetical protein
MTDTNAALFKVGDTVLAERKHHGTVKAKIIGFDHGKARLRTDTEEFEVPLGWIHNPNDD